jgi:CCR4-NOT transcription complex subunit 2
MMRHQDRRPIIGIGPMGGMGVLGMGGRTSGPLGYPGSNEHHPPILDPSEFPSLTSRNLGQGDSYHQSLPAKPYVGMVKQPQTESTAFTMTSEDFPALPGTVPPAPIVNETSGKATPSTNQTAEATDQRAQVQERAPVKHGIITSADGKVTNIPGSMVDDQFGMVGLLTFIRVAESDPNLVSLALGFDLTALGLNLNATESLYPSFGGPWAEGPVRAEDIEYPVPQEYNISDQMRHGQEFVSSIREKLAPLKMNRYKDELLFYLFYTYTGDALQILAASELYNRDWRYHKEEKIWICRAPGVQALEKGTNFERGTYYFFDPISWRKVAKEFYLEYDKLEERPGVPPSLVHSYLAP